MKLSELIRLRAFYGFLILLSLYILYIIHSYIALFLAALAMVIIFDPFYKRILAIVKKRKIATLVTVISMLLIVVIPLSIIVYVSFRQGVEVTNDMKDRLENFEIEEAPDFVQQGLEQLPDNFQDEARSYITEELVGNATTIINASSDILVSGLEKTINLLTKLTIFVLFLLYLIPSKDQIFNKYRKLSPLNSIDNERLLERLELTISSVIKSSIVIAITQGFLGGLIFWILGIESSVFWGVMMGVTSLIPLGSGLIWGPAGFFLLFSGQYISAIILFAYGNFVIGLSDNVIRSWMLEGDVNIHPVLTLLAMFGGVSIFGFLGIFFGPIIMAIYLAILDIYEERFVPDVIDIDNSRVGIS